MVVYEVLVVVVCKVVVWCISPVLQRIPVRELRGTDKKEIIELAIVMQSGNCPYIVSFYGCTIRDVCSLLIPRLLSLPSSVDLPLVPGLSLSWVARGKEPEQ